MRSMSMVCIQVKTAEINSLGSCEISFIGLWHVQDADSVDTKGKCDFWEDLLLAWQNWPFADGVNSWAGDLPKEISKDKYVACRLWTHLEQPQVHFQFGSFCGHRHKNETIVGTNKKLKVRKSIKTKNGRGITLRNLIPFLISAVVSSINSSTYYQNKAASMFSQKW